MAGLLPAPNGGVGRRRHAGRDQQLLHPRLRALEPGAVGPGPEHERPLAPQPVGQPVDQGRLGPDHEQVGLDLLGGVATEPGMPGLPG